MSRTYRRKSGNRYWYKKSFQNYLSHLPEDNKTHWADKYPEKAAESDAFRRETSANAYYKWLVRKNRRADNRHYCHQAMKSVDYDDLESVKPEKWYTRHKWSVW